MGKLTARKVETAKAGKHGDGDGLQLVVSSTGARKWVLRFMRDGKAREMGLGSFPEVSLAEAREKALAERKLARNGFDPIAERKKAPERVAPTFGSYALALVDRIEEGFSNPKHRQQWRNTLETYCAPIWATPINRVDTEGVLSCLTPIWQAKPETASRVRGRIERVLNAAKAEKWRAGENPAAWRGHLDTLLPRQSKLTRGHHAALEYAKLPGFIGDLRERSAIAARCLEFAILTAARSGEALGARWPESL